MQGFSTPARFERGRNDLEKRLQDGLLHQLSLVKLIYNSYFGSRNERVSVARPLFCSRVSFKNTYNEKGVVCNLISTLTNCFLNLGDLELINKARVLHEKKNGIVK